MFSKPRHPAEEVLLALLDGEETVTRRLREHLERCRLCADRLAEMRRVRSLLREAAAYEEAPARDLSFGALRRLHRRHAAISNVNEFFGALFAIVRGLRTLLAATDDVVAPGEAGIAGHRSRGDSTHG